MEFQEFPKMARWSREIIITEKIDGTNAQIYIEALEGCPSADPFCVFQQDGLAMWVGSRTRWITPSNDNYGFAAWALKNAGQLLELGPGRHFGEWWGQGIQRKYGLNEKRFSLFNTTRWGLQEHRPACCGVVPELYRGEMDGAAVHHCLEHLKHGGSLAAPGFMDPEGVVVYHVAAGIGFKKTLKNDESPKSLIGITH